MGSSAHTPNSIARQLIGPAVRLPSELQPKQIGKSGFAFAAVDVERQRRRSHTRQRRAKHFRFCKSHSAATPVVAATSCQDSRW